MPHTRSRRGIPEVFEFEGVGDAAAQVGFFNPGRFASDFRQVFDENPGQTLLRPPS